MVNWPRITISHGVTVTDRLLCIMCHRDGGTCNRYSRSAIGENTCPYVLGRAHKLRLEQWSCFRWCFAISGRILFLETITDHSDQCSSECALVAGGFMIGNQFCTTGLFMA